MAAQKHGVSIRSIFGWRKMVAGVPRADWLAALAPSVPIVEGDHVEWIEGVLADPEGVRAVVAVPNGANPVKVEAIRGFGAEVRFVGKDFDDCRAYVERTAETEGMHYLSSGDEPLLITGVATHTLEILEEQPDLDAVIVPVGGGSGAAGACLVVKAINPQVEVIGVQSERAPAAYRSWKEGRRVEAEMKTFAEGLATRAPFDLTQAILRRDLTDFVLVSDDELRAAMILLLEKTRNLVDGAGAAALGAVVRYRERFRGKRVALIVSGGNVSIEGLRELLSAPIEHPASGQTDSRAPARRTG